MPRLLIPVNDADHVQGAPSAPLSLVEYGDYQCTLCRLAHTIIKQINQELGQPIRLVFRHFPLTKSHPYAQTAAEAAEAAAQQGKFWEMHELIYAHQASLQPSLFPELAAKLLLDLAQFQADSQSAATHQKIAEDFNGGVGSGVNGTPCFYINGERYDGDLSYQPFKEMLQSWLPN